MKKLLLITLALMLVACSVPAIAATQSTATPVPPTPTVPAPTATPDYSDLVITLEHTACFGFCPMYHITVYGDGRVVYEGDKFVGVEGRQESTITPEQVQQLVDAYQAADYFNLPDEYTAQVTDLPSTITSVSINGEVKTIVDYGGCLGDFEMPEKAPQALCEFEALIDTVTNSAQWVATPAP